MKKVINRKKTTTSDGGTKVVTTTTSPFRNKVVLREKYKRGATETSPRGITKSKDVKVDGKRVSFKDTLKTKGYKRVEVGKRNATGGYDVKIKERGNGQGKK